MNSSSRFIRWEQLLVIALLFGTVTNSAPAQLAPAQPAPDQAPPAKPAIKQEELDQMLAPIALYPDQLLSQVLMASTYPLEVVQADRWVIDNKDLKGDQLAVALEKQTWDPSVKSLVNFPSVLHMLNDKIDRTIKLGDAFIADQKRVMDSVQKLRAKAQDAGNLKTTPEQTVSTEREGDTQVIIVESSNPQVYYVPTYDPTYIYGTWWYPSYPPYYYYPPGYVSRPGIWFGAGVAIGAGWGYAWAHPDWHHGNVDIDINRNININNRIDRAKYQDQMANRDRNLASGKGTWQHDPAHRQGVAYRDAAVAQRYGGVSSAQATQARQQYRGRPDAAPQNLQRNAGTGAGVGAGAGQPVRTNQPVQQNRPNNYNRPTNTYSQPANNYSRPANDYTGMSNNAFQGVNNGAAARSYSQQGQASRTSAVRSSGGGGAARSGGGARAGGGGRR